MTSMSLKADGQSSEPLALGAFVWYLVRATHITIYIYNLALYLLQFTSPLNRQEAGSMLRRMTQSH